MDDLKETEVYYDFLCEKVLEQMLSWGDVKKYYFFIPGKPVPLARQRTAVIPRFNKKPIAVNYSPEQNKFNQDKIYSAVLKEFNYTVKKIPGPYSIAIKFVFDPLKSVVEDFPTSPSHGDLDNLEKMVLDALFFDKPKKNRKEMFFPFFEDDRHIIASLKFKRLANPGEQAGIHLWVFSHG